MVPLGSHPAAQLSTSNVDSPENPSHSRTPEMVESQSALIGPPGLPPPVSPHTSHFSPIQSTSALMQSSHADDRLPAHPL